MTVLTPGQVAAYVLAAGFQGTAATRAVSVALAESGGNTAATATNHDQWRSRDRGLFQINSHWHPEVTDAQAYDPASASAAAYRISKAGKDWSAWSTWTNGKAAALTGRAALAVSQAKQGHVTAPAGATNASWTVIPGIPLPLPTSPGDLGGVVTEGKALGQLAVLAVHAGAWISDPHNWLRVAMVTAGTVGVIVAGVLLAESGSAGSTVAGATRTAHKAVKSTVSDAATAAALA